MTIEPHQSGKVVVYEADDGWRWSRKAGNGETLASGEAYVRKIDCLTTVSKMFPDTPVFEDGVDQGSVS